LALILDFSQGMKALPAENAKECRIYDTFFPLSVLCVSVYEKSGAAGSRPTKSDLFMIWGVPQDMNCCGQILFRLRIGQIHHE